MPPAPTSWIARIGLRSPSATHCVMTSCARRWISGLPRCTESKSSSAEFAPAAIELAAPPPIPIRMPGPPSWINNVPASKTRLDVIVAWIEPTPPAIMMGL